MQQKSLTAIASTVETPCFIYDETTLLSNIHRILAAAKNYNLQNRIKLYIAYFTNSNPHLFRIVKNEGVGILLQTREEYEQLKKFDLATDVVISPSFLPDNGIDYWKAENVVVNLASLEEVEYFVNTFNAAPSFRIDLTKDADQRTAIKEYQLKEVSKLLAKKGLTPRSFHVYVGTGSSLVKMKRNFVKALQLWKQYFPQTKEINLGGGFKFDYEKKDPSEKHFDWDNYFKFVSRTCKALDVPNDLTFIFEPGRDVFADVGSFLVSVVRIVKGRDKKNIATDGSYVLMPSATIRKRQHALEFFDKDFHSLNNPNARGVLSGSTTLSSDYLFPGDVFVPENLDEGDYVLVKDIGAYGATQHMEFLNKKPVPEVLIKPNGQLYLITRRGRDDDKIRNLLAKPKKL